MSNTAVIRILNIVAVIAATVGGASTVPDLNLPKSVLAYGLFVAMLAKAVSAELVQVKGVSDEQQGISPAQKAVQASADAAIAAHAVPSAPASPPVTNPVKTA